MNKKILVPLANGFETIEALVVVDVFRRADITVDVAAVGADLQVRSSHNILVTADMRLSDCADKTYDAIVLPGGLEGSENLRDSALVVDMLKKQNQENKLYGAICAAPVFVLEHHGLLEGKTATCFPASTAPGKAAGCGCRGIKKLRYGPGRRSFCRVCVCLAGTTGRPHAARAGRKDDGLVAAF